MPSLVGSVVGGLLGGRKSDKRAERSLRPENVITNFRGGGLSGIFSGGQFNVASSPERQQAIQRVESAFGGAATNLGNLRGLVTPGQGLFTNAVRDIFGSARRRSIGNLRDSLARRRVLGSSFAADAIGRREATIDQAERAALAEANLAEIDANFRILQSENQALIQEASQQLQNLNLEAEIAANISQTVTSALGGLAAERSQLFKERAQGFGALGRDIVGDLSTLTGGFGGLFPVT